MKQHDRKPVAGRLARWLGRRDRRRWELERDLEDEISLHLDLRARSLLVRGLAGSASEARAEAVRRFGAGPGTRSGLFTAALKRERRMRIREWLDGLGQDLGYVMRTIGREPALSAVIVVTLALGIGANATMFGLIDRLLLRGPAHVVDADALYRFYRTEQEGDFQDRTSDGFGYASYVAFRDNTRSFDGVAAYKRWEGTVGQAATAEGVMVGAATADFFPLLGVRAYLGRFPDASEDTPPTGENVAVLDYDFWQRRFGGDNGVIGQTIIVNDESNTIIGVAPRSFTGVELGRVDVWLPMSTMSRGVVRDWPVSWNAQWLKVVGRLKAGVSVEQANQDATLGHRAAYTGSEEARREARMLVNPVHYDGEGRVPLEVVVSRWLLAVAAIVLLIACANVMNLLLARSARRRREVAVRLAMGISRARLLRLLVLHGLVLAAAGGVVALLIVGVAAPLARNILLPNIVWTGGPIDSHILVFTLAVALFAGAFTSAIPAMRSGRHDLTRELKAGVREGGGQRSTLRTALMLGQITLTFVLLVGAGLFARSLSTVRSLDLGIEPDRVLSLSVSWAAPASTAEIGTDEAREANRDRRIAYYSRALERVRQVSAVQSAAVAIGTPFASSFAVMLRVSGHDSIPLIASGGPYVSAVSDGFFETTGLQLQEGRRFTRADRAGSEPVAIVNRTMADLLWPSGALDQCLYLVEQNPDAPCSRVVGVVENANRFGLREEPAMQYYIPRGQEFGFGGEQLLVRPTGQARDPALIASLRAALIELDPGLSYVTAWGMQERIDPQVRPWKLGATLFALFGCLALVIAAIGLYSVIAYMVADRTHEIGVRKVLGANRGAVLILVIRRTVALVAAGLVAGSSLALFAGRFIQPALFETSARDPFVFGVVAVVTLLVALLASALPAWRAGRVDPAVALRAD